MVLPLPAKLELAAGTVDISVRRVATDELHLWNLTVAQGFAEHFPVSPEILEIMKVFAQADGIECYLAKIDGQPAGGGTLAIRDGVAGLFGASTLPGPPAGNGNTFPGVYDSLGRTIFVGATIKY
jgi:hypothetical protein